MSPTPANDDAVPMTADEAHELAATIRGRIAVSERAFFAGAVQRLAAETADACAFPSNEQEQSQ